MLSTEIRNDPSEQEQKRLDTIKDGWDEKAKNIDDERKKEELPKLEKDETMKRASFGL
jgi:hypothetical protein